MQLTNSLFVLAAALASVSAHPSHHHHHERRTPGGYLKAGRPTSSTEEVGVSGNSKAASVESTSSSSSSSSSSSGTGVAKSFCGGATSKRATYNQIMYTGNTGQCGWGSNMMEIPAGDESLYDYTITFRSPSEDMTCHCFNKMGPDGGLNGSFQNSAIKLSLPKGSVKSIACDANTQGVCACGFGDDVPVCSAIGQWIGTWAEFDMGSSPNGGQSGADVSVLAAQDCADSNTFPGMRIAANGKTCSWVKKDGVEEFQAYINGNHDADGVGCTGYTKNNLDIVLGDKF